MSKMHGTGFVVSVLTAAAVSCAAAPLNLRPPAVPLVTHDPYFSIWSQADRLTDVTTTHWTGRPHPLKSSIHIDGKAFRVIGVEPAGVPALPQVDVKVWPTRTIYRFESEKIRLTLTFTTPALPDDLDVLARPLTYINWDVCSADGKPHAVSLDFGCGGELAVNTPEQAVEWTRPGIEGFTVWRAGAKDQKILANAGDDLRIEWGYAYLASPDSQKPAAGDAGTICFDLGQVAGKPVSRHIMLAYDDLYSINYLGANLRPYWRRNGAEASDLLKAAERDYEKLVKRCRKFDGELMADLADAGGERYALLCALVYRQTLTGNKLAADASGKPLLFPKENFSNGCISTVDVLFPQSPFFLVLSPALTKAMLMPVLDYAASRRWKYDYAPHDLGTYPKAIGQIYGMGGGDGDRMPLEESGNMLIIMAALAKAEGNADLAKKYWPMLTKWADYCVREGLDPSNQLCSADMFGHMPRASNLALKAIIGIGGYAKLCELAGKPEDAKKYMAIARDYIAKWQELSKGDGRTLLAYGNPGTWAMKHNMIWDRVLGLNIVPSSIVDAEIDWYLKVQKKYGLPVDNRTDTSLIDWALWSMAPAKNPDDFQALLTPIFNYANETPSRVPLSDWFCTVDSGMRTFRARPVVGGVFIKMLADEKMWRKYVNRSEKISGDWAKLPVFNEISPTSQKKAVNWRYTMEQPAADWQKPGFSDAAWKEGPGGFGTKDTPGGVIRTEWKSADIWLRREFEWKADKEAKPALSFCHDEDLEVYINGVLVCKAGGFIGDYEEMALTPEGIAALTPGKNVLAVHCRQTTGGQYVDVGIFTEAAGNK